MDKIDFSRYVIISDFDGTVSLEDSNDLLFKLYGNEENQLIEKMFKNGRIGTKEGFERHFEALELDMETYSRFIEKHIRLDSGFKAFYKKVLEHKIPFMIVSGGFENGISIVFKKENLENIEVQANRLVSCSGRLKAEFISQNQNCSSTFGSCGNCKLMYLKKQKEKNKKIIFIGDGLTDRCAAAEADIVFAKEALAEYCDVNGIKYNEYEDFHDICSKLFNSEQ